jgi:hypothetical protein
MHTMAMDRVNFYASGNLDRAANLRADERWMKERLVDSSTRFVPSIAYRLITDWLEAGRLWVEPEVGASLGTRALHSVE